MTKVIECPDCDGEGRIETLIGLTYDGDQRWKIVHCERCDGTGSIEVEDDPESDDVNHFDNEGVIAPADLDDLPF